MNDCKGLKSSLVLPVPVAQGRGIREAFPKAEKTGESSKRKHCR